MGDRDSSVGVATHCGLDGPGIESRWGEARFVAAVQTGPSPIQPAVKWIPDVCPGGKAAGAWSAPHPQLELKLEKE